MLASVPSPRNRFFTSALLLLVTVLVGTCTDQGDPSGPTEESHLHLSLAPGLLPSLVPDESRPIQQIRLTAREAGAGALVASTTFAVDPQASEWTLDFGVPIATGSSLVVTLSVELISLSTGNQLVEWSGRSAPITLQVGTQAEVENLSLVKGPLANLAVTDIAITPPLAPIREGETLQLRADVSLSDPQASPTLFWRSLNPGVAGVSGTGLVEGMAPGSARIVASAGTRADSVTVEVLPTVSSVVLTPGSAVLDALGDEVGFEAQVLDPRGDPFPDQSVIWSVGDPDILQDLGGGAFRALARGTTSVTVASQVDPEVFASAEVVVRQVVAAVDVMPEDTVAFVDETVQFEAIALDGNQNVIDGMGFTWSSSNESVASVDAQGMALGLAYGSVTIRAEAASEAAGVDIEALGAPTPGLVGVATLEVLPEVQRVSVTPNPFTFRSLDQTQAFTARAYGLDETGQPTVLLPLTDFTWSSGNSSVVSVGPTGLTADTVFATGVGEGSTVLRATILGVTGSTSVFVIQSVAAVNLSPSSWLFQLAVTGGYPPRDFTAVAVDALGNPVSGGTFSWTTTDLECFPVYPGDYSNQATVYAQCTCGMNGTIRATASGRTGSASVATAACIGQSPGRLESILPPGSPFRLSTIGF